MSICGIDRSSFKSALSKVDVASGNASLSDMQASNSEAMILDTTGSVVYTGEETCRRMHSLTKVVYLEASPAEEELLIARYLSDPKPVLWGDQFVKRAGESTREAIAHSYPQLIANRKKLYERYAHRVVPMERLRSTHPDARGFLELIEAQARPA